jgi:hypothetical protein
MESVEVVKIEEVLPIIKNCTTCAHYSPSSLGHRYDYCMRGYSYCDLQIEYPNAACDQNLSGWVQRIKPQPPRRIGLLRWLAKFPGWCYVMLFGE